MTSSLSSSSKEAYLRLSGRSFNYGKVSAGWTIARTWEEGESGSSVCTLTWKSHAYVLPTTWLVHSNSITSGSRGTTPKESNSESKS